MSRAADAAQAFFFDLLRRELAARGEEPSAVDPADLLRLVPLDEAPLAPGEEHIEGAARVRCGLDQRLSDMSVELDGESGEPLSWFLDFLAPEGDRSMPADEALALGSRVAEPPEGARLVSAGYERRGGRTHYRARWEHEHEGLRVEGDFVEVLLNGRSRRVFSLTRRWHTPRFD